MAIRVSVDLDGCMGYACCMMEAPNVFDIDDESGKAVLLVENPPEELRDDVERGARSCPARVIAVEEV